jgi:hypothetical protein
MTEVTVNAYDIRFLGDLQRLEIKPGDKFVLTCPHALSLDTMRRIEAQWHEFAGADVQVLILCDGMKLGAVATEVER